MSRDRWIASPAYDLPLIVLAPLVGVILSLLARAIGEDRFIRMSFFELNFFFLGMPHYLSTYAFYLDDANVSHYKASKLVFFIGPFVVVGGLTAAIALHFYNFLAIFVDSWNGYHVSRQSAGIFSVYRHRSGGATPSEKWPALLTIVGSAIGFLLLAAGGQPSLVTIAGDAIAWITHVAAPSVLTVSALAGAVLAWKMLKRGAALPEWMFLASSILLFVPYVLTRNFSLATGALLAGHYVQYLSLLWLVNRRKYVAMQGSIRQRFLTTISKNGTALAWTLLSLALVPFAIDRMAHHFAWTAFHTFALYAIVLLHFYLDGVFWAFKDPYVRRSLGPFLTGIGAPSSMLPGTADVVPA